MTEQNERVAELRTELARQGCRFFSFHERTSSCWSNEPGYYKEGSFGIRIENLVAVEILEPQPEGAEAVTLGFETLTLVPYARSLMDRALLTQPERTWIDAYHARVREVLTPLLAEHPSTCAWLADATRPLDALES